MLIDTATAEVIHIDLGVAFEQGKLLKTPETIPFRLTRDIVDGMGVTGAPPRAALAYECASPWLEHFACPHGHQ